MREIFIIVYFVCFIFYGFLAIWATFVFTNNMEQFLKRKLFWRLVLRCAGLTFPNVYMNNIPKDYYKSLNYALFESHMSYCISVFGHV